VSSPKRGRYQVLLRVMESQLQRRDLVREILVGRLGKGDEFVARGKIVSDRKGNELRENMRKRNEP
jgi:hypothetical protein